MGSHPIDLITDAMLVASDIRRIPMTGLLNATTTCGAEPLRTQEPSSAIVTSLNVVQSILNPQMVTHHLEQSIARCLKEFVTEIRPLPHNGVTQIQGGIRWSEKSACRRGLKCSGPFAVGTERHRRRTRVRMLDEFVVIAG